MKLSELNKNDSAIIFKVEGNDLLKGRLLSFGITRGSELTIEACSMGKKTIEILVDDTLVGLRLEEADSIKVEKI